MPFVLGFVVAFVAVRVAMRVVGWGFGMVAAHPGWALALVGFWVLFVRLA